MKQVVERLTIFLPEREAQWLHDAAKQAEQTEGWIVTQALRTYSAEGQPISKPVGLDKLD